MIVVLHGAKKNVGDFLIRHRGVALLKHLVPDHDLVLHERWRPLPDDLAAEARSIVICGGPGLSANFYPHVYRLVPDLRKLEKPVLPIALGWRGEPMSGAEDFRFLPESKDALEVIHSRISWSTVRDDLSLGIMGRNGIDNVRRSGCVAWYHLPSLGRPLHRPHEIRHLVFTPPAQPKFFMESLRILVALKRRFPKAARICSFHRGLKADEYTRGREANASRLLARAAQWLGFEVIDASFDLSAIEFYESADLHVGYRVHAHLYFLSVRRPSLLISEDGRGLGQALSLGDPYALKAGESGLADRVLQSIDEELKNSFASSDIAVEEIERTWPVMQETIGQLYRS